MQNGSSFPLRTGSGRLNGVVSKATRVFSREPAIGPLTASLRIGQDVPPNGPESLLIKPVDSAVPVPSQLLEKVRELEATERRMASLLELGQRFMAEREPLELLPHVCDVARALTEASLAGVAIVSEDLERLERLEICGLDEAMTAEVKRTLRIDDTIRRVLVTRQPARGRNPGGDPAALGLPAGHPPVHSFLMAPLVSPSRVYGWFALADKAGAQAFSDVDERIATTLGAQVGMALERAHLVARLHDQMDALRGHDADMEFAMSVSCRRVLS